MIMKPIALECVLGGPCKFKTIKLEFAKAFQLLELHMKYVHTPIVSNEEVNTSNHDDDLDDSYEIEELMGDKETCSNNEVDDNDAAPVEKLQSDFADVTLVRNDRDPVENHKPCTSCGRKTHSSHRS